MSPFIVGGIMLFTPLVLPNQNIGTMHAWELMGTTSCATDLGLRMGKAWQTNPKDESYKAAVPFIGALGCGFYRLIKGGPGALEKYGFDILGIGLRMSLEIKF